MATPDQHDPGEPPAVHPGLRSIRIAGQGTWRMSREHARSMLPILRGGETIRWRAVAADALEPGDLVFYGIPASRPRREPADEGGALAGRLAADRLTLSVHRLVRIERSADGTVLLRTKGDGRPAPDVEPIPEENLVGVVYAFEREGRLYRLDTPAARRHARRVLAVSRLGAAVHRPAVLADAVLRRLTLRRFDPRPFRALAAGAQAAAQRVLHRLAFRRAHPPESASP
ncbi:MAG: hypothetical protein Kow0062_22500 [Acidobacteriota bacterium]